MTNKRKAQQALINARCMTAIQLCNEQMEQYNTIEWYRLDCCQAWTADIGDFKVLKSYNTIVAIIYKPTGVMYDILRLVYGFTNTSAKHISKFRRYCTKELTYRSV